VFYRELAEFYPDAKVVLTVRNPDEWYESARATIFSSEQRARTGAGELGGITRPLLQIVGRVVDLANVADKDATIAAFNRHNEQVKATIPAARLLVYDVGEGWESLSAPSSKCRYRQSRSRTPTRPRSSRLGSATEAH
jgi:hypothetical protein